MSFIMASGRFSRNYRSYAFPEEDMRAFAALLCYQDSSHHETGEHGKNVYELKRKEQHLLYETNAHWRTHATPIGGTGHTAMRRSSVNKTEAARPQDRVDTHNATCEMISILNLVNPQTNPVHQAPQPYPTGEAFPVA